MKTLLTTAAAIVALSAGAAQAGDVTVTLTGVQARGGVLLVALQTEGQFMQQDGLGQLIEAPAAGDVTITFRDVPPGDYALSAFHDQNADYQMQTAANGIPEEGWAMSHGETLRGPPTFAQVSFTVPAAGAEISEPMFYWDGQIPGQ